MSRDSKEDNFLEYEIEKTMEEIIKEKENEKRNKREVEQQKGKVRRD